ncbi:MAG: hypothetical protein OEM52_15175 [bacterium]|nr:hypothetical protein [bacterium]
MNVQTMLVLGALTLIGAITLLVNRNMFDTSERVTESNVIISALSLGEATISSAMNYRYDESVTATTLAQFTVSTGLGPESGEVFPNFDDVDDFNRLNNKVTMGGIDFQLIGSVYYVDDDDLSTKLTTTSYNKRMMIQVKSAYLYRLPDSAVTLSYVATYQKLFK